MFFMLIIMNICFYLNIIKNNYENIPFWSMAVNIEEVLWQQGQLQELSQTKRADISRVAKQANSQIDIPHGTWNPKLPNKDNRQG